MKRTADALNRYDSSRYTRTESPPPTDRGVTANPGPTTPTPTIGLTTDQHQTLHAQVQAAPRLQGAAELILNVANGHALNSQDPHLPRQEAANMLMRLGWDVQLRQLAQALPMPYLLNAGRAHDVQVLGRIGASWPPAAPVFLVLPAPLQINDVETLKAFLACPEQLHVHVVVDKVLATGVDDPSGIHAWRKAMNGRPVESLKISVHANDVTAIHALHGVKAAQIVVHTTLPPEQQVGDLFNGLVRLVKASDAATLDIGDSGIDHNLGTHLLCCKQRWEHVIGCSDIHALSEMCARHGTIDALTWNPMTFILSADDNFSNLIDRLRVQTLTVMGPIHFKPLCDAFLNRPQRLCTTRIDGFFVVPDGQDATKDAIRALKKDKTVQLHHLAMDITIQGLSPIDTDTAQWLAFRASTIRATYQVFASLPSPALAQEEAITAISNLLASQHRVLELIDYLKAPGNPLVKELHSPPPGIDLYNDTLSDKLHCLKLSVPNHLLTAAIDDAARHGHLKPAPFSETYDVAEHLCRTIIELGIRPPQQRALPWVDWCHHLQTHWMLTRTLGAPRDRSTVSSASTATAEPVAPVLAELLTTPGDYQMSQLMARLKAYPGMPQVELSGWFIDGKFHSQTHPGVVGVLTQALAKEGQWKLMAHFLAPGVHCSIQVKTPEHANHLAKCPKWPDGALCHLDLAHDFPQGSLAALIEFAQKVPRDLLRLQIPVVGHDNALWKTWQTLIIASPGLGLTISPAAGAPVEVQPLLDLLVSIRVMETPLSHISLTGFLEDDARLSTTLAETMVRSRPHSVAMRDCHSELVNAVLTCKPWQSVAVDLSRALADLFISRTVSTRALTLTGMHMVFYKEESPLVYNIVARCASLQKLEVRNAALDVLWFAKMLQANPSLKGFVGDLNGRGIPALRLDQERQALAILQSNISLRSYEEVSRLPYAARLSHATKKSMMQIVARNNWLNPDIFARAAAKGFGMALNSKFPGYVNVFADPFKVFLAPVLDPRTAKALSLTCKTAYLVSQKAWEEQEQALIDCLDPETTYATVAQQLTTWIQEEILSGEPPLAPSPSMPLMINKIKAMERAQLPVMPISQAIGALLKPYLQKKDLPSEPPHEVMPYLEALAYLGVISANEWLHHAVGLSSGIAPPAANLDDSDSDSDSDD